MCGFCLKSALLEPLNSFLAFLLNCFSVRLLFFQYRLHKKHKVHPTASVHLFINPSIFFCFGMWIRVAVAAKLSSSPGGVSKVFQELLRNAIPLSPDRCGWNTSKVRCVNHLIGFPEQRWPPTVWLRSSMGAFTPVSLMKFQIISSKLCFT